MDRKSFGVLVTNLILQLVKRAPRLFPKGLNFAADFHEEYKFADMGTNITQIKNAGLLEGDFVWTAVGVVKRISNSEIALIHAWIKKNASNCLYNSYLWEIENFKSNYQASSEPVRIGWITVNREKNPLMLKNINLESSKIQSCFINLEILPYSFAYLSLYFKLSKEATSSISKFDVSGFESEFSFQSLNPFSSRSKILFDHGRENTIRKHLEREFNSTIDDVRVATDVILDLWGISRKPDDLVLVADLYRMCSSAYFINGSRKNRTINCSKEFLPLISRHMHRNSKCYQFLYDEYCQESEYANCNLNLDAIYIKNEFNLYSNNSNKLLTTNGLRIFDSHLFISLLLDCDKQFKKVVDTVKNILTQKNSDYLESEHQILFDSLIDLELIEKNLQSIHEHSDLAKIDSYQNQIDSMLATLSGEINKLRTTIDTRVKRLETKIGLSDIKFHKRFTIVIIILVFVQILVALLQLLNGSYGK